MSTLAIPSPAQPVALPPLREELGIHPGPRAADGSPTWVLEDPASGRYFSLTWLEFEVLSRWHLGSPEAIGEALANETTLRCEPADLQAVLNFLATNSLIQVRGDQALGRLREQAVRMKPKWGRWLLKNYLFMRFPLVKPDRFLRASLPWVAWAYRPGFAWVTLACGLLGVYLAGQQWDSFLATFPHFFSFNGVLAMAGALTLAKIVHELGHAYTSTRFGRPVPTMGVALLVLWPVLYTDTTAAWTLRSRRQRLAVGAAGMLAEITLAAYALLAWNLLPEGPWRSAAFLLASSTWILTLAVNLNPLMRFDGYYLLSDLLGMPNLQDRAFAYGRWQLREWLFGLGDPPPEFLPARRRRFILLFAYATWLYRFLLFLGIALLVYHFFFKALGIFLMLVELVWFIGRPIYAEIKAWVGRRHAMRGTLRSRVTFALLFALLLALALPWHGGVSVPAVWRAGEYSRVFARVPARVDSIRVHEGERVRAGQLLFELSSPDLEFEIRQGRRQLESLAWLIQYRGMDPELLARSKVAMAGYQSEYAALQSRLAELAMLKVRSQQAGVVRDLRRDLLPGQWVGSNELFATVVEDREPVIEAYVEEADLSRIAAGAQAVFYPSDLLLPPVRARVREIDRANTAELPDAYLASASGGEIAVRVGKHGQLIPESSLYRIRLGVEEGAETVRAMSGKVLTGKVDISGERESPAVRVARLAWSVLIRETGF